MGRDLTLADVAILARVSITTVHRAEKGRALNPRIQYRLERFVEKMGGGEEQRIEGNARTKRG